jgi:hypothetical protein
VSELLNEAVPVPSFVELFAVVGAVAVFHTTPFAEMVPPLAEIPEPPELALLLVMAEIAVVVVMVGLPTAVAEVVGADAVR